MLPARQAPEHELAQLRERLAHEHERAQRLEQALRDEQATGAELFRQLEAAQLSERRAQTDARQAAFKEAKLRRQLPFRLGSTLVSGLRRVSRWWRLPYDLLRTVHGYRLDKARGLTTAPAPADDALVLRKGRLALLLKSRWQTVMLPDSDGPAELWATPLCSPAHEAATLAVEAGDDTVGAGLQALGARPHAAEPGVLELPLQQAMPVRLLGHQGAGRRIRLRHAHGSRCLLALELRRAGGASGPDEAEPPADGAQAGTDPRPIANAILWQASEMAADGEPDRAIRFAARHARAFVRPAISLLKANRAVGHDREWLQHVNDYVRQFDIAPIELAAGDAPIFERLRAGGLEPVERGPLVSVIMPVYQAQETVRFAVRSILAQTWQPLELIVVDDASSDRTWEVLRELAGSDARLRLLRNVANVGPYVSKNLALVQARGEFVTGHDADDWAHPQRLERHLAEVLRSGGRIKVSMARMLRLDERGHFVHFAREGKASDDGALRDAAISCLFDTAFMRQRLGHWDSVRFGADSELIGRARLACGDGFVNLRQLAMLCLDADASLTNDPVHGVSKLHGVSPTRAFYRDQWTNWQRGLDPHDAYLSFPQEPRRFEVPDAAAVSTALIERVRQAHAEARD